MSGSCSARSYWVAELRWCTVCVYLLSAQDRKDLRRCLNMLIFSWLFLNGVGQKSRERVFKSERGFWCHWLCLLTATLCSNDSKNKRENPTMYFLLIPLWTPLNIIGHSFNIKHYYCKHISARINALCLCGDYNQHPWFDYLLLNNTRLQKS